MNMDGYHDPVLVLVHVLVDFVNRLLQCSRQENVTAAEEGNSDRDPEQQKGHRLWLIVGRVGACAGM